MAEKNMPTYRGILRQIAEGGLVHADETKGVVKGSGHYVWVFANLTTVAYVYSESREAAILGNVLDGFNGVLVSDFYAAYDSMPCAQQKCLIHLMRDINEDLHKNPFDDELKEIARRFGALLREIVETIDTHGLKARHLGKHRKSAAQDSLTASSPRITQRRQDWRSRRELKGTGTNCSHSSITTACLGTTIMRNMPCELLRACGTQLVRARPGAPANSPRCEPF